MEKRDSRKPAPDGDFTTSRRTFTKGLLAAGIGAAVLPLSAAGNEAEFDYIIVGAGAGGGPLAVRLVKAGYKVALLDAGVDPMGPEAAAIDPNTGIVYSVPALAGVAAEHPALSWDFYVKHYANAAQQARDSKHVPGKGILYSRGSALGGSTAHNAMLFIYPHDKDWDDIADMTGDRSWRASRMREYFKKLEACDYCAPAAPGHGFNGYMRNDRLDQQIFEIDETLRDLAEAGGTPPGNPIRDVNDPGVAAGGTGAFLPTMHVVKQVRISIREYLAKTQQEHPDRLFLITGALATRLLLHGNRARGIEFMQGMNLYEASKLYRPSATPSIKRIRAKREVVLSAGVFNTPQLLKLSGIGPARELRTHGIDVVVNLPGVGENLQDRYEITINVELKEPLELFAPCRPFQPGDPCLTSWFTGDPSPWPEATFPFYGPYANNAAYGGRIAKSSPGRAVPDLFLVGQASAFHGFFPGFSQMPLGRNWTWLIIKAHTNNTAGTVKLRSRDPRKQPEINFHYFEEGNDKRGEDLDAVVKAMRLARSYNSDPQAAQHIEKETFPGPAYQTDAQLKTWIRDEAWGHHAACTAPIGAKDDRMAVLDSRFQVRGVKGLRVVDACSFPRVPGFFPVAAIFMIGEKAADTILRDARERGDDDDDHDDDDDDGDD